ncbi:MAG: hypothetical protein ACO21J_09765 [Anaerohalosphaeraceae bacterium]
MKKSRCLILSCCMIFCGCAENYHWTDYCDEFSADRVVEGTEREDYNPLLTPATDVATECYCYTEDAAITTAIGVAVVSVMGLYLWCGGEICLYDCFDSDPIHY